jgi:hypothetical protein
VKGMLKLKIVGLILLTLNANPSFGAGLKPMWQTSACYQLRMSVNDKFSNDNSYVAKYIVKAADGRVFVAEKAATDMNSSEVFFPDSFRDEKLGISAFIDCHNGQQYTWQIYVDNVLKDSGTIGFTRKKR